MKSHLPEGYSTLYVLTSFTDDDIKDAIEQKKLTPDAKRSELAEWKQSRSSKNEDEQTSPATPTLPSGFYAGIRLNEKPTKETKERIEKVLAKLQKDFKAEMVRPIDRYAEALKLYHKRIQAQFRKLAKQVVSKAKKEALSRVGRGLTKQQRKQRRQMWWPHDDDEIEINERSTEDDIAGFLKAIGK